MNQERISVPIKNGANSIVDKLRKQGYTAYWVGGCVRDMLLGIEPKDIDIATNAVPEEIISLFEKTIPVGAKFGVIVVIEQGASVEVATFRSDGKYLDSRHPVEVHFADPKQDAQRRDFTINALFYDPVEDNIIDFVNGQKDLNTGIIRGIGDPHKRFEEDALRMLRAIRFSVQFDFQIEPKTWQALCDLSGTIQNISADRIRDELLKTFIIPRAGRSLILMSECGLLKELLPEIEAMKGVEQPPNFHPEGDVFQHTTLAMNLLNAPPSPTVAFATLLHDVGKPPTFEIADRIRFNRHDKIGAAIANKLCRRLNFSNADRKTIVNLVDRHMLFLNITNMRTSKLKRFLADENFHEDLELHRVDCLASHANLDNYDFCLRKIEGFANEPILPTPFIDGGDLKRIGYKPGPQFKEILSTCLDAQLEGRVNSKEESLDFVKKNFPQK